MIDREEESQVKVSTVSSPDFLILLGQQQSGQVIHSQLDIRVQQQTWQRKDVWGNLTQTVNCDWRNVSCLTCLLCQWGEHGGGSDLQTGISLQQGWEHHVTQRLAKGYKHALFWCGGMKAQRNRFNLTSGFDGLKYNSNECGIK